MAGYHKPYLTIAQYSLNTRLIPPGIASDVGHEHIHALHGKFLDLTETTAHIAVVDIAADASHYRGHILQTPHDIYVAYIAGVPYLVTFGEMSGIAVIPA